MSRIRRAVVLGVIAAALLSAIPAQAAFPGKNGKLVFSALCCDPANPFHHHIYTVNPDGTALTQLPRPPGATGNIVTHPSWSPDGKRIAFIASAGFHLQVWAMDADGGNPVQLTHISEPGTDAVSPGWSPDGKHVVYSWINRGIYKVAADGSGDNRQVLGLDSEVYPFGGPAWSPTEDRIAFVGVGPTDDAGQLWTVGTDGRGFTRFTEGDAGIESLSWSPDGRWLASERVDDGVAHISIFGSDGARLRDLTTGSFRAPAWSPDGKQIALRCLCIDSKSSIGAINVDGSGLHGIVQPPGRGLGFTGFGDWQPIPGPQRGDYKNSNQFCKAEQAFWGDEFAERHGGKPNAFGKCVSQSH